jgi:hypothetical protein
VSFPGIAILSAVLLPVALTLVWLHRFAVSYRSRDFDAELEGLVDDSVSGESRLPSGRYVPPKAPHERDCAVAVLSEAGF